MSPADAPLRADEPASLEALLAAALACGQRFVVVVDCHGPRLARRGLLGEFDVFDEPGGGRWD